MLDMEGQREKSSLCTIACKDFNEKLKLKSRLVCAANIETLQEAGDYYFALVWR